MLMWRLIDANFNRCREGLRVIDDLLRFYYELPEFEKIKDLRHTLKNLEKECFSHSLPARRAEEDPGSKVYSSECERDSVREALLANFKRVEEALRSLEEGFKLIADKKLSERALTKIKAVRFEAYKLEQDVLLKLDKNIDLTLYLVTDSRHNKLPLEEVVEKAILGGVSIVQLREKHLSDKEIITLGKRVLEKTRAAGIPLLVDDRVDLALALGAEGVHLGQNDLGIQAARKILGPGKIIGKSTHSLDQVKEALKEDLDYIAFGPLYATPTKDYNPVGLSEINTVKDLAQAAGIPVVFIGGVTAQTLKEVLHYSPGALAVVREIMCADNPEIAARALKQALVKNKK